MDTTPAPLGRLQTLPSWLLGRAATLGHRLVSEQLAEEGVRMPHHAVLCGIAELGPIAQAELSRTVRIDPKDMVTVLNELQAKKLISRTRDPRDARKNALALTTGGRALLRRLEELSDQANDALLAPLAPAERKQLAALLARLIITE
ncbi:MULTISPECIES: MarR family winged helix-turn-helix transcriptional regulator [unclassified Kitasatospora]|uniref:MarR family winged helix-turn-helix transcriptional regulator n=1 Tax=unclassified Kitasatospora TaxID=2633591 RepID=UPI00070931C2|nr:MULTISPECIES: MarR family transcriptional regulator [unclassified Kitasatospora]KQV12029.1 MarR family transcriptional regulator [Kitasatospora sp. Root107]KRB72567.1 MarR family transcriptional regulator [Kitasatospora sp. Root187]